MSKKKPAPLPINPLHVPIDEAGQVLTALEGLNPEERVAVLRAACGFYDLNPEDLKARG